MNETVMNNVPLSHTESVGVKGFNKTNGQAEPRFTVKLFCIAESTATAYGKTVQY